MALCETPTIPLSTSRGTREGDTVCSLCPRCGLHRWQARLDAWQCAIGHSQLCPPTARLAEYAMLFNVTAPRDP